MDNQDKLPRVTYTNNYNEETRVTLGELAMEAKANGIPANIAAWSTYLMFSSLNRDAEKYKYSEFLEIFEKVY